MKGLGEFPIESFEEFMAGAPSEVREWYEALSEEMKRAARRYPPGAWLLNGEVVLLRGFGETEDGKLGSIIFMDSNGETVRVCPGCSDSMTPLRLMFKPEGGES